MYYTQNLKTKANVAELWALVDLGIPRVSGLNVSPIVGNVVINQEGLFSWPGMMLNGWLNITKWRSKIGWIGIVLAAKTAAMSYVHGSKMASAFT